MDYGAGLQPLIPCALKPGALPQAGMNRAFGAGRVVVQPPGDFQSRLEPTCFSQYLFSVYGIYGMRWQIPCFQRFAPPLPLEGQKTISPQPYIGSQGLLHRRTDAALMNKLKQSGCW